MAMHLRPALMTLLLFTLITGVAYPLLVTGIAQAVFPYQAPATSGCIMAGEGCKPGAEGSLVYLHSKSDLDGPLARVKAAGGKVAKPKTALPPGMGFFAHFVDSEGNRVGIHSIE